MLLNSAGRRFVDELATRDVVAGALMQQPEHTAWLLLGHEGAAAFGETTLQFYAGKGLVTKVRIWVSRRAGVIWVEVVWGARGGSPLRCCGARMEAHRCAAALPHLPLISPSTGC